MGNVVTGYPIDENDVDEFLEREDQDITETTIGELIDKKYKEKLRLAEAFDNLSEVEQKRKLAKLEKFNKLDILYQLEVLDQYEKYQKQFHTINSSSNDDNDKNNLC
ncbi:hypothetical protein ma45 [Moumouvirus australiensis]|uniref:Uncharacterized protein n=1 Tax=Moumouvirus australiensis TaxID=2109587 RepID=A0A2P1EKL1_9VIRU|nr:hypothetical protein QKC55_gp858 [Moumouvirus australiensis]AVL94432.1 hypothetical protein ma45 [Moumouvirus australiensis]QGR53569.1 hypothetical protein [Moumouvirus maliensis]